jgi:hypothetical protein
MVSYIPVRPEANCLCGSGELYASCCRLQPLWRPICPDPGMTSYSFMEPQTATYYGVDGVALRERLMADVRLHCPTDEPDHTFWNFWGDPAVDDPYGTLCFGDFDLKKRRTLVVSALSGVRLRVLQEMLEEVAGDHVGTAQLQYHPSEYFEKKTGTRRLQTPRSSTSSRRRK